MPGSDFEIVDVHSRPMICVSRHSSMDPDTIAAVMGEAMAAIGQFIASRSITPLGPPFAIYSDWDDTQMTVRVGVPVSAGDHAKAEGDVQAGDTPSGRCVKALHHGPYPKLRETYAKLEEHFRTAHAGLPALSWEVYVSDPETTPEAELVTEIYMPLPDA